jgi:hypothetical protein
MAQSRHEPNHAQTQTERATEHAATETERATERGAREAERATERGVEALRQQTERVAETVHEGARRASETSAAAFSGAGRAGSTLAQATQEIVGAWTGYVEDVIRNTSQAREALVRSRSMSEMMRVQANLVRDNLQSFLNQNAKLADSASRVAIRPLEILRDITAERTLS